MQPAAVLLLMLWPVAACASGSTGLKTTAADAPRPKGEQLVELAAAESLYRFGERLRAAGRLDEAAEQDELFAERRDQLAEEPTSAIWLTRMLLTEFFLAERRQDLKDKTLVEALQEEVTKRTERARRHILAMGPAAVPTLIDDLVRNLLTNRRQLGGELLADIGSPAIPAMQPLLQDADWRLRKTAVAMLVRMQGNAEVSDALRIGMKDAHFGVRAAAAEGLGAEDAGTLVEVLTSDPDSFPRRAAGKRLAELYPSLDGATRRRVAETLVAQLEQSAAEGAGRDADAFESALRKLAGVQRRGNVEAWKTWLRRQSFAADGGGD